MHIAPMIAVAAINLLIGLVWSLLVRWLYANIYPAHEVLLIYGKNNMESLEEELLKQGERFHLKTRISLKEGRNAILREIKRHESVMLGEMPEEERTFYIRYCYEQKKRCYCQTTLADILLMSSEKISLSDKTLQLFRNCGLTVEQRVAKRVFDIAFSALVLVLLSAVFCHLSGVFQNNQIGDISFYMIYLLLFLLLLQAFDEMTGQMERLLEGVAVFMKALLPAYYIALTGACGVATATAFYQMILILIFLTEKILLLFLLPAIRMYLVLELINFLTKEEFLSKMTELLKNGILWALKSMIGVIVGIQLIQRMISPAVDTLKRSVIGRTAGAIPGVGNLFSGVTEVVLGSAVLIKNGLGAAAIVILLLAGAAPLCRMGISALAYQFLAAVVQPVTDKRMVGCIHTMGESLGLLVRLLLTMEILFLLTIAILAGSLQ